jgi:PAS domain S-box-containing protein
MEFHMITQNIPTLSLLQHPPGGEQNPVQDPTQHRYLALINTIPSALIAVGSNDLITDWNQSAERLFGVAKEQAIGLSMNQVNIPWDADTVIPAIQACLGQGDSDRLENIRFTRPDGGSGLLEITTTFLGDEELPDYVLLINDITERKR